MMRYAPRYIHDDTFFLKVWRSKISIVDIAVIYGTSRAAIYRAAQRFGHGPREPKPIIEQKPEPKPESYAAQLVWSKGRWSELRVIAEDWGKTLTQVQADFHKVRKHAETGSD